VGHVRSSGMSRLSAVLIVYAALSATTGLANVGACAEQITQLRQAARLDHEPTPESVRQLQTYAQLRRAFFAASVPMSIAAFQSACPTASVVVRNHLRRRMTASEVAAES
jgi:hypothetical protein